MSDANLKAELEQLRAENAKLKKAAIGKAGTMKVTEKGGVSVYGMGRFPATYYKDQWLRILDAGDDIRAFIEANNSKLKQKGD